MPQAIRWWICVLGLVANSAAYGALYNYNYTWTGGFVNGGRIPDGDATGWHDMQILSDIPSGRPITDVQVRLHIIGVAPDTAFIGDLYGYLAHSGGFAVLLNRVGVTVGNPLGYGDNGLNVTLTSSLLSDIHSYGGNNGQLVTGTYGADGRNIDPRATPATFDAASRSAMLDSFNGMDPNGSWTLFFADFSGGSAHQVTSWGLDITAAPEPANVALGVFGGIFALVGLWRTKPWKRLSGKTSASNSRRASGP